MKIKVRELNRKDEKTKDRTTEEVVTETQYFENMLEDQNPSMQESNQLTNMTVNPWNVDQTIDIEADTKQSFVNEIEEELRLKPKLIEKIPSKKMKHVRHRSELHLRT